MRPNGANLRLLVRVPDCRNESCNTLDNPRWSPDGRFIATVQTDNLWRYAWDGTSRRRLTNSAYVSAASWSPSGREIAFERAYQEEREDYVSVWIIKSAGGPPHRILKPDHRGPDWSPDGKRLVVVSDRQSLDIVDRTGKRLASFKVGGSWVDPRWSPNGHTIAFAHNGLKLLDVATGSIRTLFRTKSFGDFLAICWAPDNRWLAYVGEPSRRPGFDVWLVRAADGRRIAVRRGIPARAITGIDWTAYH